MERGKTTNHLLRRLTRDHAEIMSRWENAEFATVREAAWAEELVDLWGLGTKTALPRLMVSATNLREGQIEYFSSES